MDANIRTARTGDAPGIAHVHTQSWRETYRGLMPGDFLERMTSSAAQERRETSWGQTIEISRERVYVADLNGEIVAFASVGPARDHPGYDDELMTLYSLQTVQGHGIGRQLLHHAMQDSRTGGAKNMALWVLDRNPTRQWYARQGATEAGEKQEGELREIRMVWDDLTRLLR